MKSRQQDNEKEQEEIEFEDKAVELECKYCYSKITTKLTFVPSPLSFILLGFVAINFGLVACVVLIYPVMSLTANKSHKCPACYNILGKSTKIINHWGSFRDKVIPLSLGNKLAVIVSTRLILNLVLATILIINFLIKMKNMDVVAGVPTSTSWEEFLQDCGEKNFRQSPQNNNMYQIRQKYNSCEMTYLGKTFQNWKGYVVRIEDNRENRFNFFHATKLLIKMQPEEFKDRVDLVLFVNRDKIGFLSDTLRNIEHGSEIVFNATLKNIVLTRANHLHVMNISITGNSMDIPDILHENSRYELHEHKKKLFKRHEVPKFREADVDSENPARSKKKEKSSYPEKKTTKDSE